MELTYVGYLKIMRHKRDLDDHCRYVAKQQAPNEEAYNERMADFKDWYNEEIYQSLEKLYKLYLLFANQGEVIQKRSTEENSIEPGYLIDFLAKLRLYLQNQGVDPGDNAGGPPTGRELRDLMYGTIRKGDMTIDELYRKLLRIGRRANYRPEELRRKFLDALPLPWLEKAEDIGEHLLLDELAKKLYEIELRRIARQKRDRIPDPLAPVAKEPPKEEQNQVSTEKDLKKSAKILKSAS
ncbi:7838_t:CDS:2 [Gigaspora margarita]|uniref:7838_t:CDS:1 n=2 Tax=Gigaspora margarita TaxID=4874 RepID=A0ABN7V8U3_GIGMA|nr:7838_t:CDS:2 [Gigaspora margarita]